MRAIILAAGRGRRLAPMDWVKPKCLLPVGGRTLLDNIIETLIGHGIRHVVTVVGYQRELVEAAVRGHPVRADFVVNEDYAETNTIHSLWLARDYLDDEFVYFNADVFFDSRIVGLLLERKNSALAVEVKSCGEEEVKVIVDAQGRIRRIGKNLSPAECLGEFENLGRRDLYFESAVDDILEGQVLTAVPLGGLRAVEIDTPEDYDAAKTIASLHREE